MKYVVGCLIGLSCFSCATMAPYSGDEYCALQGLKFQGIVQGTLNSTGYDALHGSIVTTSGQVNAVSCEVPRTPQDSCRIIEFQKKAGPKVVYNDSLTAKKWVTGIGYVIYILPGVAAKLVYDGQYDTAVEESNAIGIHPESCSSASNF